MFSKTNMEVFNKIYSQVSSSVSSTVSQLSGVLLGNPVTREFDATEHIASGGPGLQWKIYKGMKKSTKQEASIFVFEKRQLDKYSKTDRDIILEVLRRGITQVTKIRHPQVLTIQHPLEESRETLAFATEPVFASVANILGETYNMPKGHALADHKFYDIEIKYGLLQIGEGLAFLHNDMKLLHKNICPETIIVNHQGVWKIFGFDFCVHNTNPVNAAPCYPLDEFVPSLPNVAQPSLDYMAPECILSQNQSTASDMFSLGMVAFAMYSPSHQTVTPVRDIQQFRGRANQMKNLPNGKFSSVPDSFKEYLKLLLHVDPSKRLDAHEFVKIPYFDDVGVKTLNYLDSLLQWDNLQKSQFYKGLPEPLGNLPQRVRLQRVFPCLVRDLAQPAMVPFVLPNIMDIAQHCNQQQFVKYIFPFLKPVMKLTEPVQILLIFLQRMELLLKLTPAEDVQLHVLPMLYRGLDSDTSQIHELCLTILPTFAGLLDHANVKNHLLPRIKKLCLATSNLSVRVNCLLCIGRLLEHLDKWLVLDDVLPFLPQISSREPAVLMGILGIYKLTLNHKKLGISKEIMASKILPFLMPLVIENGLSLAQFNALVALIKQMFQTVEGEQRSKLEQLNSVQNERKVLEATMPEVSPSPNNQLDTAFSGLGLDTFMSTSMDGKTTTSKLQDTIKIQQSSTPLEPIAKTSGNPKNSAFTPKNLTQELTNLSSLSPNVPQNAPTMNSNVPFQPLQMGNAINLYPNTNINNLQNTSLSSPTNPIANNYMMRQPGINSNNWNQPAWQSPQQMQSPTIMNRSNSQASAAVTPAKNWSALDNLLPNNSNANKKIPLNQMISNQSFNELPIHPVANNNSKTTLSNDDIMDLLS